MMTLLHDVADKATSKHCRAHETVHLTSAAGNTHATQRESSMPHQLCLYNEIDTTR